MKNGSAENTNYLGDELKEWSVNVFEYHKSSPHCPTEVRSRLYHYASHIEE